MIFLKISCFVSVAALLIGFITCQDDCRMFDEKPTFELEKIPNVPDTNNYQSLTAHAGYARWPRNDKDGKRTWKYSPIGLDPVKVEWNKKRSVLNLASKCSNITITYGGIFRGMTIELDLGQGMKKSCSISELKYPQKPEYLERVYYNCREFRRYNCTNKGGLDADGFGMLTDIAFVTFTYEMDGNPDIIRKGNYSKTEYFCV